MTQKDKALCPVINMTQTRRKVLQNPALSVCLFEIKNNQHRLRFLSRGLPFFAGQHLSTR